MILGLKHRAFELMVVCICVGAAMAMGGCVAEQSANDDSDVKSPDVESSELVLTESVMGVPVAVPDEVDEVPADGRIGGWPIEEYGYLWLVSSRQELDDELAVEMPHFGKAPAALDGLTEDFFEQYDLLAWSMATGSGGDRYEMVGLEMDGTATAVLIRKVADGMTADVGAYSGALALPKRQGGYGEVYICVV